MKESEGISWLLTDSSSPYFRIISHLCPPITNRHGYWIFRIFFVFNQILSVADEIMKSYQTSAVLILLTLSELKFP